MTHERALSPADLFGGKAPVGGLICLLERISRAYAAQVHSLGASVTAVSLPLFVFGGVLIRLD